MERGIVAIIQIIHHIIHHVVSYVCASINIGIRCCCVTISVCIVVGRIVVGTKAKRSLGFGNICIIITGSSHVVSIIITITVIVTTVFACETGRIRVILRSIGYWGVVGHVIANVVECIIAAGRIKVIGVVGRVRVSTG